MNDEMNYLNVQGLIEEIMELGENGIIDFKKYFSKELYQFMVDIKDGKVKFIKEGSKKPTGKLTKNGLLLLKGMKEYCSEGEYTSKEISEKIGFSSRGIAGTIRGLVSNGYVSKDESKPIKYTLTQAGKDYQFD